jgi:hypothetical protein
MCSPAVNADTRYLLSFVGLVEAARLELRQSGGVKGKLAGRTLSLGVRHGGGS